MSCDCVCMCVSSSCVVLESDRLVCVLCCLFFFLQAEEGIRDLVRSRGLGDVYKRQGFALGPNGPSTPPLVPSRFCTLQKHESVRQKPDACLLYTSDAADERSSVDLGGRRIINKKKNATDDGGLITYYTIESCYKHVYI